jgi:tetratricopeptide (TPR) repeat protein
MKILFLTLVLCLNVFSGFAEVTLRGTITYQNTGSKMTALQITARGASPTITRSTTNTEGVFVLTFPNGKVGDLVILELGTPIYDLVNDPRELNVILTDHNTFKIRLVVCKKGERDANAVSYYNISTQYLESNYQKEVKKRDNDIAKLQNQLAQNGANTDALTKQIYDLYAEKAKLEVQLEAQKKSAFTMAEDFSRIDLAEADALFRKAFDTFKKGDIDGARAVLSSKEVVQQANNLLKLEADIGISEAQVKMTEANLTEAKAKIAEAKLQRDTLKTGVIKKKMLDGQLAILQNKFDEAERLYTEGVNLDSTQVDNVRILASFLNKQNKKLKAITYFELGLSHAKSEDFVGKFCNSLGSMYLDINKIAEAERYYLQALDIFERLSQSNPQQFDSDLASITGNLGNYYDAIHKMPEAEKYYLQSLDIRERLSKSNPQKFDPHLAAATMSLGNYYSNIQKMAEAEKYYLQSLDIRERLSKSNPQQFEPDLASTAINLGIFYLDINKPLEAEKSYLLAFDIYERLAKSNPKRYELYVAKTAMNFGLYYESIKKMPESERYYLQALDIYTHLSKSNPQQFEPELARTAINLGNYYKGVKKMLKSEKYYLQALDIFVRLAKSNPQRFEPDLGKVTINVGNYYRAANKMPESEKYYLQALGIFERLSQSNPQQFESYLAITAMNVGSYYSNINKKSEAEKYYLQSLDISERLAKSNPKQFEPDLGVTLYNLGLFYQEQKDYMKANAYLPRALAIFDTWVKVSPAIFEGRRQLIWQATKNNYKKMLSTKMDSKDKETIKQKLEDLLARE